MSFPYCETVPRGVGDYNDAMFENWHMDKELELSNSNIFVNNLESDENTLSSESKITADYLSSNSTKVYNSDDSQSLSPTSHTFEENKNLSSQTVLDADNSVYSKHKIFKYFPFADASRLGECSPIYIEHGPGKHQIKDKKIKPAVVLLTNYYATTSDFIIVKLLCDPKMALDDPEIFLTAVSPLRAINNRLYFDGLKVFKDVLQGRTKDYKFYLIFSLIRSNRDPYNVISDSFFLWSNINQAGFPRNERKFYKNSDDSLTHLISS